MNKEERVWAVEPHGNCTEVGDTKPLGSVAHPYVPEQRALDAERERDAYRTVAETADESWTALRAERDALRADLLALVPLARVGDAILTHMDRVPDGEPLEMSRELFEALRLDMTSAARAILDRVATEEGT